MDVPACKNRDKFICEGNMMRIRHEAAPFIAVVTVVTACTGFFLSSPMAGCASFSLGTAFLLFFFRDPERTSPPDSSVILSGADGRVMSVTRLVENAFLNAECVRISVFLSILDVHVRQFWLFHRHSYAFFGNSAQSARPFP